jgi:outer membrane lipoprotein-sorting protein
VPGPLPELSDDQVNLLYRTSLGPQRFSAELREWADPAAVLRLSAFGAEQGPMASVFRRLMPADDRPEVDLTARLQVAMPGSYRLDARYDPGRHPACTSCDGNQLWQVYPDRVVVRPPAGPPRGISLIIDPIWLLSGYRLSVEGSVDYGGRPCLRLTAVPTGSHWSLKGPLSGKPSAADRIEADIDTELGIIVRQDWHYHGRQVLSAELSGVTTGVDPAAFTITPAPGVKVVPAGPLGSFTSGQLARGVAKGTARMAAELGIRWLNRHQP